jgi:flagellar hook-basal body complex protein FliE
MFLNEEFLEIYEELSELNEAKADTQKLIDFAGEDLANRFLAIKNSLKGAEKDLYYWIKNKTVDELEQTVISAESAKANKQIAKEITDQGAKLVCTSEHWTVYHITSFEASQKYGRDTKWCITGVNNWGDIYWNEYKSKGVDFYFLITNDKYDPRGYDSKFALAIYPDGIHYEAFDQKDGQIILEDIKYIDEIKIPGVDLWSLDSLGVRCSVCNDFLFNGEENEDSFGEYYCDQCWEDCFG